MKSLLIASLLAMCVLATNTNTINFTGWVLKYTIDGASIKFQLTGTNLGYVALGIGGSGMDNIDAVAFNYQNNAIVIEDRNNIDSNSIGKVLLDTAAGGTSDYTLDPSSTYNPTTGAWSLIFSRLLNTGDKLDQVITDGSSINMAFATFSSFTWQKHNNQQYSSAKLQSAAADPLTITVSALIMQVASLFVFLSLLF